MPRFNGTGPEGKGPKTGRGMGKCQTNNSDNEKIEDDDNTIGRCGRRRGCERGRFNQ